MRCLYEVLGISPDASATQVHAAYRARAKEAHPDSGGSNDAFHEVVVAYKVLGDAQRRKQYDENGATGDNRRKVVTDIFNEMVRGESVSDQLALAQLQAVLRFLARNQFRRESRCADAGILNINPSFFGRAVDVLIDTTRLGRDHKDG